MKLKRIGILCTTYKQLDYVLSCADYKGMKWPNGDEATCRKYCPAPPVIIYLYSDKKITWTYYPNGQEKILSFKEFMKMKNWNFFSKLKR